MRVRCTFRARSENIPCTFHARSVNILCIFHARSVNIPCTPHLAPLSCVITHAHFPEMCMSIHSFTTGVILYVSYSQRTPGKEKREQVRKGKTNWKGKGKVPSLGVPAHPPPAISSDSSPLSSSCWWDRYHFPNLGVPKEGHDGTCVSLIVKYVGDSGGPRGFPATKGPYVFPHHLALGLPGLALIMKEEVVTGLPLVLIAPPAFTRGDLVDLTKVVPSRSVPRQELVLSANRQVYYGCASSPRPAPTWGIEQRSRLAVHNSKLSSPS